MVYARRVVEARPVDVAAAGKAGAGGAICHRGNRGGGAAVAQSVAPLPGAVGGLQAGVGGVEDAGTRDTGRGADRDVGEGIEREEALPGG
eukprot:1995994-Prymnesium_polylepis.1